MKLNTNSLSILMVLLAAQCTAAGAASKKDKARAETSGAGPSVLWRDPADITSRNLFYGPGGKEHVPHGTFTFVKEDLNGSSPKFDVVDRDGGKWKVKLGLEARPETVATRLVWAAGYNANEDYFVPELDVAGMPERLHRGREFVDEDGIVHNARLKRMSKGEKKTGNWEWRHDPFLGTRELNGLKVIMALINNWDLKDINNAVYEGGSDRVFMVSDLGASFGSAGRSWPREKAKDNLDTYGYSRFIRRVGPEFVDFQAPARPQWEYLVNPKEYISRLRLEPLGRNIPIADARWMGELLGRLSKKQISDAFRASGYSPQEVEGFSEIVEKRIAILKAL